MKLIVIACNSATATALGDLQRTLDVPVIGVLTPEARAAVQLTRNRRVGLLATEATIASGRYRDVVHGLDAGIELVEVACPGLADAIQRGETYDETMVARVRAHCAPLRAAEVDTVILGCTHYPLIRGMLQRELGRDVALVSAAEELAEEVAATLARKRHRARSRPPRLLPLRLHGRRRGVRERRPPLPAAADLERAQARRGRARGTQPRGRLTARARAPSYTPAMRHDGRAEDELRPLDLLPGFVATADGSVLFSIGRTRVICTASVDADTPRWLRGTGRGWVSAEYGMLPASTGERKQRDSSRGRPDGRSIEIQRLIGRSLRAIVDLEALGERTVWVDCDVLQADGGTRCAAICGGYVALHRALSGLVDAGKLRELPLTAGVAAVSCGIVEGEAVLDLDYKEDSSAEVDLNVVMTSGGRLVEVQGTAEGQPFDRAQLDRLLELGAAGMQRIEAAQLQAVAAPR